MRPRFLAAVALSAAAFHLFSAGIAPFTALVQRPVHLALMGLLGFWAAMPSGPDDEPGDRWGGRLPRLAGAGWRVVLSAVLVVAAAYLVVEHESLVARSGAPTSLDLVLGIATRDTLAAQGPEALHFALEGDRVGDAERAAEGAAAPSA